MLALWQDYHRAAAPNRYWTLNTYLHIHNIWMNSFFLMSLSFTLSVKKKSFYPCHPVDFVYINIYTLRTYCVSGEIAPTSWNFQLTRGVLKLFAPSFFEICSTATKRSKDTQAPDLLPKFISTILKIVFNFEEFFFRYNLKPIIIPSRTPKSSVLDWNFEDFAIFPVFSKILAIFRVYTFLFNF